MSKWDDLVSYANAIRYDSPKVAATMDALAGLISRLIGKRGDRYSDLTNWLEEGVEAGLLTTAELNRLRSAIAPNM